MLGIVIRKWTTKRIIKMIFGKDTEEKKVKKVKTVDVNRPSEEKKATNSNTTSTGMGTAKVYGGKANTLIPTSTRNKRQLMVGPGIKISGEISNCEHLIVEGIVDAELANGDMIEITPEGLFTGKVNIIDAEIAGKFEGSLKVTGTLTVRSTGVITGNVEYGNLSVESGALIDGEMKMLPKPAEKEKVEKLFNNQTANVA